MAGKLAELIVKIGADVSGFGAGIRGVSAELDKMVSSTSGALRGFRSLSGQIADVGTRLSLGVTLPLAGLAGAAVRADANMESLMKGLTAVTGSAGEAGAQFARLKEVAKLPGLGMEEAVKGAINLQAAGLSAQTSERALKAFGNALATVGKGKAELDGVILALGQIESKGKISAEEINQLAERIPQIRVAMKGAFGTADTESLSRMGISSTAFIEKITAELEKLKTVDGGINNAFENIQDSVKTSLAEIGAALKPATVALLGFLQPGIEKTAELARGFKDLPTWVQGISGGVLAIAVAAPPALAALGQLGLGITGLTTALPLLKNMFLASAGGAVALAQSIHRYLIPAVIAGDAAALALGYALTTVAAGAAIYGVVKLAQAYSYMREGQEAATKGILQSKDSLEILRIKLHQAGVETGDLDKQYRSGLISLESYTSGLLKLVNAHSKVQAGIPGTAAATADLNNAFKTLGITSAADLQAKLKTAQEAQQRVTQAFKNGAATSLDLANANTAVKKIYDELHPTLKQISDDMGSMQGPKTLRDDLNDIFGSRAQSEANQYKEKLADLLSGKRWDATPVEYWSAAIGDRFEQLGSVAQILANHMKSLWAEIDNESAVQRANRGLSQLAANLGLNVNAYQKLADAKKRLGIGEEKNIGQMAADLYTVKDHVSKPTLNKAELDYLNEKRSQGNKLTAAETARLRELQRAAKEAGTEIVTVWDEIGTRLKTVFQDVSKSITNLLFEGGKFKDMMLGVFTEIGKGLTQLAIEKTLASIGKHLLSITKGLPGIGKIAGLFGGGASGSAGTGTASFISSQLTGSGVFSAAAPAASGASALSSSTSSMVSTVAGVVGAIGSVGTMISSIVFGMKAAKDADVANKHSLQQVMQGEVLDTFLRASLGGIHDRLVEFRTIGMRVFTTDQPLEVVGVGGAFGGGGLTLNVTGNSFLGFRDMDTFVDDLVRRIKARM